MESSDVMDRYGFGGDALLCCRCVCECLVDDLLWHCNGQLTIIY